MYIKYLNKIINKTVRVGVSRDSLKSFLILWPLEKNHINDRVLSSFIYYYIF